MKKIVIALGGNALEKKGQEATSANQLETINDTCEQIAGLLKNEECQLVIVHGNGPQVGRIIIQNESSTDLTPAQDFDVCGAMSQGMIGYHIQQSLQNKLKEIGVSKGVVSVVTQVMVDKGDKAFENPTKPIGLFYDKEQSDKLAKEKNWSMKEDAGRGYRRVVASPKPQKIVELENVKQLLEKNNVVITCGGGGVPVALNEKNQLAGVAGVIDKDLSAQRLANDLNADALIILTEVDSVFVNFGKENQKALNSVSVSELKKYIEEDQFAPGSMLPKVEACINFAEESKGSEAIITSLANCSKIGDASVGTRVK